MREFLKTTIVGGVVFLLPVALILFILGYAVQLAAKFIRPIANSLHLDGLGNVGGGVGVVTVLAVLVLVFVSFAAGMFARTKVGGAHQSLV